jgi:hypothetical protein
MCGLCFTFARSLLATGCSVINDVSFAATSVTAMHPKMFGHPPQAVSVGVAYTVLAQILDQAGCAPDM